MAQEEGAEKGGDVQPVAVGVGQDANLAVAQAVEVLRGRVHPQGRGDVVDLLGGQDGFRGHFPGVEDLAPQGHYRLEVAVPGLLGRTAGRVALHEKQFAVRGVLADAVGQLAREGRTVGHLLARYLLAGAQPLLGVAQGQGRDLFRRLGVLVEPEAEGVLHRPGDEGGRLARGEPLLGLAGELGILHLDRQHVAALLPDIVRGQAHAAGDQLAKLAKFADRSQQAAAEAVDMGPPKRRGNEVDIAFAHRFAALAEPGDGPVDHFGFALGAAHEGDLRHDGLVGQALGEIIAQPVLVVPLGLVVVDPVDEAQPQPGAQDRLGPQHVAQPRHGKPRAVEVLGIGPEVDRGAGVALAHRARFGKGLDEVAVGEGDGVALAVTADLHLQPAAQGVDHRDADPVQPTGEEVVLGGKLRPGVQPGHDQLHPADTFLGVEVHRHSPAVVPHFQGLVLVEDDLDLLGESGDGLVDAVVHHLLGQMVGSRGVGIHAGATTHRLQAAEDLDGFGVVGSVRVGAHGGSGLPLLG